jgi:DNA polymerase
MSDIKKNLLKIIAEDISRCTKCDLHKTRTNTVPGEGPEECSVVFLGEGPGADEDKSGRPFVGRSGKLLTKMIESTGLKREDVHILNVCKCRPPDNRKPTQEEMDACKPYLEMQLKVICPDVLVTLGATATDAILGPGDGITKRRAGKGGVKSIRLENDCRDEREEIVVVPTLHPSYLLRNPPAKEDAAEDLSIMNKYRSK